MGRELMSGESRLGNGSSNQMGVAFPIYSLSTGRRNAGSVDYPWSCLADQCTATGVVLLQSPLLAEVGVAHAFTTRVGGLSPKPFDSLNLGDLPDPGLAEVNRGLVKEALACPDHHWVGLRQVHGANIVCHSNSEIPSTPDMPLCEGDGLVCQCPGTLLGVLVADCVPILLSTECGRVVAAVHAGWRGLVAGVIGRAVAAMSTQSQADASSLLAAIGPCIGMGAFEVGYEVATQFERIGAGHTIDSSRRDQPGGKPHIELASAAQHMLQQAGLQPSAIDCAGLCTHTNHELFFSYRRDGVESGRQAAVIASRQG